jgi:hypothetical protein
VNTLPFHGNSAGDMSPPRKREPLPDMPLECPSCGSDDVDEAARECRACKIGLPIGAPTRKRRRFVAPKGYRITSADLNGDRQQENQKKWRR